jgi:hypothetical protein
MQLEALALFRWRGIVPNVCAIFFRVVSCRSVRSAIILLHARDVAPPST